MKMIISHLNPKVFLLIFVVAMVLSSCSTPQTAIHLIQENNYYGYVVKREMINFYNWDEEVIFPITWDAHCYGGVSAPWNPLIIRYTDANEYPVLDIQLAKRDIIRSENYAGKYQAVNLNSSWIKNQQGEFYASTQSSFLKIKDDLGNELTLVGSGYWSLEEMVDLIAHLERINYSGSNPWDGEWCNHQ